MTEAQNNNNDIEYVLKTKPSVAPTKQAQAQKTSSEQQNESPSSSQAPDKRRKKRVSLSMIIVGAIVLISLAALVGINIINAPSEGSTRVAVVYDGDGGVHRFPLDENAVHLITSSYGENTVEIKDGIVQVIKADCANQICVETAPISQNGETIVCLPHKLYVTITDSENSSEPDIDAVAS